MRFKNNLNFSFKILNKKVAQKHFFFLLRSQSSSVHKQSYHDYKRRAGAGLQNVQTVLHYLALTFKLLLTRCTLYTSNEKS